jgi:hypothetical protein
MSDSSLTSVLARTSASTADMLRQEQPAASITLTRTSTLAITTAGTTITWQSQTRGQGITWSGATITIPTAGYYGIQVNVGTTGSQTMIIARVVNNVTIGGFTAQFTATNYFSGNVTSYFATGDTLQIRLTPGANTTMTQVAEFSTTESPILHIVQLTSVVT